MFRFCIRRENLPRVQRQSIGDRIPGETLGEGSRSRTRPNNASLNGGSSPPRKKVRRSPSYEPYRPTEATTSRPSERTVPTGTKKMPPRDPAQDRDKRHTHEASGFTSRNNQSEFVTRDNNGGQDRVNTKDGRFNKWDQRNNRDHKDRRPNSTQSYAGGFPRKSLAGQSDVFNRLGNASKRLGVPSTARKPLPTSPAASKKNRRNSRSQSPESRRDKLHTSQRAKDEPSRQDRVHEDRAPQISFQVGFIIGQWKLSSAIQASETVFNIFKLIPTSPIVRSAEGRIPAASSSSRPAPVRTALPPTETKQVPSGPASARNRPKPIHILPNVAYRNPPLNPQQFPARAVPSGPRAMSSPQGGTPGTPSDSDVVALDNVRSSLRLQHEIYDGMRGAASADVQHVFGTLIESDPDLHADVEAFWGRVLKRQPTQDQLTNLRVLQGQYMIVSGLERQEEELQTRHANAASTGTHGERYQTGSFSRQQTRDDQRAQDIPPKSKPRMHPLRNESWAMIEDPQRPLHQSRRDEDLAPRRPENEHMQAERTDTRAIQTNQRQEQGPSGRSEKKKSEEKKRLTEKKALVPYEKIAQVGEGTYGKVYKARNGDGTGLVALKRIRMEGEKDGFPVTAMREIKLLQSLDQENIVKLYEMMISHGSVHMVMEYMDHDLSGILSQPQITLSVANLKSFCQQMLRGLAYLHRKAILHRDMKGSNILINSRGELKLADFGLARHFTKRKRNDYTNRVVTLWYRSPELLLGETMYDVCIDNWSAGCIMLELFVRKPVFQGNDEIHQLEVIYEIMGTPTEEEWPGLASMPWYELVKPKEVLPSRFEEYFAKSVQIPCLCD
ncbi:hypothetical protein QFC22_005487 [Naganishia vaughanmartiniae]|uniref:Uncharacterized protein n=1 Tax=Naganishia vaughanmartiniae TaxID=1424756 RepID=A0ACC2WTX7_9TREE|nr:hypothetical protein QFC22_005487 [Naganishia vaughanmartiniae]